MVASTTPPRALALHGEPRVRHDAQHPVVALEDLEHDALDPARSRADRQLLEQPRAHADPLQLVGDGERHLRRRHVAQAVIRRQPDDAFTAVVCERSDQGAPIDAVRVEVAGDEVGPRPDRGVVASRQALGRERDEERHERRSICLRRSSQAQRAAVAEDHVGRRRGIHLLWAGCHALAFSRGEGTGSSGGARESGAEDPHSCTVATPMTAPAAHEKPTGAVRVPAALTWTASAS